MFKKTILISLLFVMAAVFAPIAGSTADAADAEAAKDTQQESRDAVHELGSVCPLAGESKDDGVTSMASSSRRNGPSTLCQLSMDALVDKTAALAGATADYAACMMSSASSCSREASSLTVAQNDFRIAARDVKNNCTIF